MNGANTCTGQNRIGQFGYHGHVDTNSITFFNTLIFEYICQLAYLFVQLVVSDMCCGFLRVVGFKDNGRLLASGKQMSIDAILGYIELRPLKPFNLGFVKIPLTNASPGFAPQKMLFCNLTPKHFGLTYGFTVIDKVFF